MENPNPPENILIRQEIAAHITPCGNYAITTLHLGPDQKECVANKTHAQTHRTFIVTATSPAAYEGYCTNCKAPLVLPRDWIKSSD